MTGARAVARTLAGCVICAACIAPAACIAYVPQRLGDTEPRQLVRVRFSAPRTVAGSARRDSIALRDVMRLDGTVADRRGDTLLVWVSRAHAARGERVSVPAGARARLVLDEGTIIDVGRSDPAKTIGYGALAVSGLILLWFLLLGTAET